MIEIGTEFTSVNCYWVLVVEDVDEAREMATVRLLLELGLMSNRVVEIEFWRIRSHYVESWGAGSWIPEAPPGYKVMTT